MFARFDFGALDSVHARLAELTRDLEPASLDGPAAKRLLAAAVAVERLAGALKHAAVRRVETSGAWAAGSHRSAGVFVAAVAGTTVGAARRLLETAAQLDALPATDAANRAGELSPEQLRAVTGAASVAPHREGHLLDTAARTDLRSLREEAERVAATADPEALEAAYAKAKAERHVRMWTEGYVGHIKLETTLDAYAAIKAVLDDQTRRVFRRARREGRREPFEAYAADAFAELVCAGAPGHGTKRARGRNVALHVCVDLEALRRGDARDGETCEIPGIGPVPVAVAREYLGHAFLTMVIRKGVDIATVAHLGRYIPAELRTALYLRGVECTVAECANRGYLEWDHRRDHAKRGLTSFENLAPMCRPCHTKKTAGWVLGPPDPCTGKRTLTRPAHRNHDPPEAA